MKAEEIIARELCVKGGFDPDEQYLPGPQPPVVYRSDFIPRWKAYERDAAIAVQVLREAGLLLEWHKNTPASADKLADVYGEAPVCVTYVKDGKIKESFDACAIDAHLYSPFGASHFAIISPPQEAPNG